MSAAVRHRRARGRQCLRLPRLRWVVRHPLQYLAALGFGPVQLILLPTLVGGVAVMVLVLKPDSP
ncbi:MULTISPECIES: hypothetical protein [unclassified Streptomyces]|uniref:hypothetical protein n=1 Tax=unclassified Streptomyces TaxID=2593676 RepID=UPI0011B935EA|nr:MULTISPECIES: hypothetical protein [unclassified Streptomyces]MYT68323.1 hypothetical protein [Streptomyces sp. SID8367]